jgi:hypothetical protein
MNKFIAKIKFLSEKSLEMTFIYVDKRLISHDKKDLVYFNSNSYDFLIYSRKTLKKGHNSLRLPSINNYKNNMKDVFDFTTEKEMYMWLKKLHRTLNEANNNYTPFIKEQFYKERPKRVILNGEFWIL